jgi:transcriptional regulator with XRE-family HTH domain
MSIDVSTEDVAETLRTMRRDYRLTMVDFAALLGISRMTLSNYIHGHVQPSRLFTFYLASKAEEWKQNPPEPSPARGGGYRGDRCAQRAPKE